MAVSNLAFNDKINMWKDWLNNIIKMDIGRLLLEREYYKELGKIVSNNEFLSNYKCTFWEYLIHTYVVTAAIGIRMQCQYSGGNTNDISINKILIQMIQCNDSELSTIDLNKIEVQSDSTKLTKTAEKINELVNKRIAHFQIINLEVPPNKEIFDTIDFIYCLYKKYYTILHPGSVGVELFPINVRKAEIEQLFGKPWLVM